MARNTADIFKLIQLFSILQIFVVAFFAISIFVSKYQPTHVSHSKGRLLACITNIRPANNVSNKEKLDT
jgi:hypothetical protein